MKVKGAYVAFKEQNSRLKRSVFLANQMNLICISKKQEFSIDLNLLKGSFPV